MNKLNFINTKNYSLKDLREEKHKVKNERKYLQSHI